MAAVAIISLVKRWHGKAVVKKVDMGRMIGEAMVKGGKKNGRGERKFYDE